MIYLNNIEITKKELEILLTQLKSGLFKATAKACNGNTYYTVKVR